MIDSSEKGFGLTELVAVIAIILVILTQAMPSLFELQQNINRSSAREILQYDIARARAESVATGARSIVQLNLDGSGYTVGIDVAPFSAPPSIEEVVFTRTFPSDVAFNVTDDEVIAFDSRGLLVDEFGEPTTIAGSLLQGADNYSSVSIYSVGRICFGYDCAEI